MPDILASRYAIHQILGEGGFGQTFRVSDRLQADQAYVLKILKNADAGEAEKEFELLRGLYHPHIVEVVSSGVLGKPKNAPYLVFEYVDGTPLDQAVKSLDSPADWEPIAQLCRTLSYLHSRKVVHGDLKPGNVLVQRGSRQIKLIDFGLSGLRDEAKTSALSAGTLAYMAPETISKGRRSPASDLYGLGMILLQILSGKLPFPARSEAAVRFHLKEDPDLSFLEKHPWKEALGSLLEKLLNKEPSQRFHDALEVLSLLNAQAKTRFEIHRGWQKTDEEGLFFQKLEDYLGTVNGLLQLATVKTPRSFLEDEERRLEKYLALAQGVASGEKSAWLEKLNVTKARLLMQQGRYEDCLKVKGFSDGLKNIHALACIYRERYDQAVPVLQKIEKESADKVEKARAVNYLGMAAYQRGELDRAQAHFEASLAQMKALKETLGVVSNGMNLAAVHQQRGRIAEALKLYKETLEAAEALRNSYLLSILLSNIANLHLSVGDLEPAQESLDRASAVAAELDLPLLRGYGLLLQADILMWRRDFAGVEESLRKALAVFKEVDSPLYGALAWINLAENAYRARQWSAVEHMLPKVSAAVSKTDLPEVRFRLALLEIRLNLALKRGLASVPAALDRLEEKAAEAKDRFQIAVTRAHFALSCDPPDVAACETHLDAARNLLDEEQKNVPIAYRTRMTDAPRYGLFWEVQTSLKRAKAGTGDASLWHLIEINKRLVSVRDPRPLYGLILDAAIELLHAERGFLIMPEYGKWKRGTWKVQVARNFRRTDLPGGRDLLSQRVVDRILKAREPLLIHDAQDEEAFKEFRSVKSLRLRSILAAPIRVHGEIIGAVYLDHTKTEELFTDRDLEVLMAFADQAGLAITNARLYDEAVRQQRALDEARKKLEDANRRLEEELKKKTEWADKVEEELKKVQAAGPVVARSPVMRHIVRQLPALAGLRAPVLITGEPGNGKDLIARVLHQEAGRGPFVTALCQKLPRQKTDEGGSEALSRLLEEAKGGTLHLDEMGDMPVPYQRELLATIEAQETSKDRPVFLVLSSRTRLKDLGEKGLVIPELQRFLSGTELHVPPLRERKEDIGPLVQHILKELNDRHGIDRDITRAAKGILHEHEWPGNVRELELELERAARGCYSTIGPFDLSPNLLNTAGYVPGASKKDKTDLHERREQFERDAILQALEKSGWNKVRAAKRLGLSRAMLYVKIQRYRIPLK